MSWTKIDIFEKNPFIDEIQRVQLEKLLQEPYFPAMKRVGNDVKIVLADTLAYRKILTLKNVNGALTDIEGYYYGGVNWFFEDEEKRYYIRGQIEDIIGDTEESFEASFENMEVEIEVYNACANATIEDNPWTFLREICFSIYEKIELESGYSNAEEIALLPLMREVVSLERYWLRRPKESYFSYKNLKHLAAQYGYKKVEKLLEKLETIDSEKAKFYRTAQRLQNILCGQKYESLWREIFDKILKTQIEYANKVEALCDGELLSKIRMEIQRFMESNGYLTMQFLCGTAFLKKNEQIQDIYSCVFNAKGRRIFYLVHGYEPIGDECIKDDNDIEISENIAVKKTECVKLNKTERKQYYGKMIPGWRFFLEICLIMGGLFAVALTMGLMLYAVILMSVFGMFKEIPEILTVIPWWKLFVFSWIGFGGTMGIIELLGRRK